MKVYTVIFDWATEDASGIDVEVFDAYEKAVNRFNQIIKNEKDSSVSWVGDAFDEDGDWSDDYDVDYNGPFTDGEEHELWWHIECKNDWFLHDHLELRILEVK